MKLSLVVLFCDKDYTLVSRILKQIDEKILITHEVIAVDNRDRYKDVPIDLYGAKLVSRGCNMCMLSSRKFGASFATGDYIWHIDADDQLGDVITEKDVEEINNADMVIFNCKKRPYDGTPTFLLNAGKPNKLTTTKPKIYRVLNNNWNKWHKKSVYDKVMSLVPDDVKINNNEDYFTTLMMLQYSSLFKYVNKCIYIKSTEESDTDGKIKNINQFKRPFIGNEEVYNLIKKYLNNTTKKYNHLDDYSIVGTWFIFWRIFNSDTSLVEEEANTIVHSSNSNFFIKWFYENIFYTKWFPLNPLGFFKKFKIVDQVFKKRIPKLSCIVLFCDKDYKKIPKLLKSISHKVKIPHEVILVDNTEKYRDTATKFNIHDSDNVFYFTKGKNIKQLAGRKLGVDNATGKYIWFIDADDKIKHISTYNVGDCIFNDYDLIQFNYCKNGKLDEGFCQPKSNEIAIKSLNYKKYKMTAGVLWNKWIEASIAKNIYNSFPSSISNISAFEDGLTNILLLQNIHSWYYKRFTTYNYIANKSYADPLYMTPKKYVVAINGFKKAWHLIKNTASYDTYQSLNMDRIYNDLCSWFVYKIASSPKKYWQEEKDLLKKEVDYNHALRVFSHNDWFKYKLGNKFNDIVYDKDLSICVIAYDGNKKYFTKEFFKKIKSAVQLDYEICIQDMTSDSSIIKRFNKRFREEFNISLIKCSKNMGTFRARVSLGKSLRGKYCWFIDADDKLSLIDSGTFNPIINSNMDIVSMNAAVDYDSNGINGMKQHINSKDCWKQLPKLTPTLWNKWFKSSVVVNVCKNLSFIKYKIIGYEDNLLLQSILAASKSIKSYEQIIYTFNNSGVGSSSLGFASVKAFDTYTQNLNHIKYLNNLLFKDRKIGRAHV